MKQLVLIDSAEIWDVLVQLLWMTLAFGMASDGTACVIVIRPTATDA